VPPDVRRAGAGDALLRGAPDADGGARGRQIEPVGRPGSLLGWVDDATLLDVEFDLAGGESLVLYTDGVIEARTTGDAYGSEGLEELLRAAAGQDAAGIAARVDRAAAHAGKRCDDVAVLVGRVRP
jgi:serine phosphatase RsbU (regulator of sigma subunit)